MRFCVVSVESELEDLCGKVLDELLENCVLIRAAPQSELPEADVYIWDFQPASFNPQLVPEMVTRSLFVVEPQLLDQFRERLGTARASIVLKPVQPATLQPFLEHAIRQRRMASSTPSDYPPKSDEKDDLLESLLAANLKLQEYDQARTNFLARAVHDFRAPLTALDGYCGLLTEQRLGPISPDQLILFRRMQQSVQRLSRLAEAMFDLSAGRRVKREMSIQEADVEASICQAVHEIMPHALEKQIRVSSAVEPPDQPFLFDTGKIEQALMNLLENACKFTSMGGTIDISAYPVFWHNDSGRPQDMICQGDPALRGHVSNAYRIDIRDSGCGIAAEHIDTIFEEYVSYGGGKDRSGGGLGLAICRMIVDAHQGAIWAESGPMGTQFSLVLPYRMTVSSARNGRPPARVEKGKRLYA